MSISVSSQINFERNLQTLAVQQKNKPRLEQMQEIVDFVKAAVSSRSGVQIPMDKFKSLCTYASKCKKGNSCPYAHTKALQDTIRCIKFFNQMIKSQPSFKLEECRHGDQCKFGVLKCHYFHPGEEPQIRKVSRTVVSIPPKLPSKAKDSLMAEERGHFDVLSNEEGRAESEKQIQATSSSEPHLSLNPKWEESFAVSLANRPFESESVQTLKEKFSHVLPAGFEFFDARGEAIVAGIVDSPYLSAQVASSALSPLTLEEISDDEKEDPAVEVDPTIAQPTGFFDESGVFTDEDPRFAGSLEEESVTPSSLGQTDDEKTEALEQYLRAQLRSMQTDISSLASRVHADSKPSNYKTIPCKYMQRLGYCNFQERCAFAHSKEEQEQGLKRQRELTGRVSRPLAGYAIPATKALSAASWRKAE